MKKDGILRNTLVLTLMTLILGTILGFVQHITAEPIAISEQKKKDEACLEVFADASGFEQVDLEATGLGEKLNAAVADAGLDVQSIDEVYVAKSGSGDALGYVITVSSKGYGGNIQFVLGVDDEGQTKGISYLNIEETAGLGMRATSDDFKNQFKDKTVEKFTYTKSGATSDDEIDAMSGATVTTNAMTNGVNAGLVAFRTIQAEGGV